jgi:hypothetical protein
MREHQPSLDQLQRWLLAAITSPAGIQDGILSPAAQEQTVLPSADISGVMLPSLRMTADERLNVYRNAYFARLVEALHGFFPCLAENLGNDVFSKFAFGYLQRYPSQSYTLNRLADRFVQFLQETRPTDEAAGLWTEFWIDLARLELAIDRVFDAPGPENEPTLTYEQLAAIDPAHWPMARIKLATGFELLAFQFPVGEYYSDWKQDRRLTIPQPKPSFAALARRDYIVRRFELSPGQWQLLSSLSRGETLGDAIACAADAVDDFDALARDLQIWFRQWAADGLFSSADV